MLYYVKWVGYSEDECSWEPVEHLTNATDLIKEYHANHPDAPWAPRNQMEQEVRNIQNPSPKREGDTTSCRMPRTSLGRRACGTPAKRPRKRRGAKI
jgi:hypothetical protein